MPSDETAQLQRLSKAAADLDKTLDKLFANAVEMRAILKRISDHQSTKADGT